MRRIVVGGESHDAKGQMMRLCKEKEAPSGL